MSADCRCPIQVATPEDPSSARRGETLYSFMPRSVKGNLADGIELERKRLADAGLPLMSLHNRWGCPGTSKPPVVNRWHVGVLLLSRGSCRQVVTYSLKSACNEAGRPSLL